MFKHIVTLTREEIPVDLRRELDAEANLQGETLAVELSCASPDPAVAKRLLLSKLGYENHESKAGV